MEKKCRKCGEVKDCSEFHKQPSKKDGLHCYCKQCAIDGAKKSYNKNRDKILGKMIKSGRKKVIKIQRIVQQIKARYGCYFCGEKNYVCLDMHHLERQTKEKNISGYIATKSVLRLLEELDKCICVCANCHRKIQYDNLDTSNVHPIVITEEEKQSLLSLRGRIGLTTKTKKEE